MLHEDGLRARVADVQEMLAPAPWQSKSGAALKRPVVIPMTVLRNRYFAYAPNELRKLPGNFDIGGLRIYTVAPIPAGAKGAYEFHPMREEIVIAVSGRVRWTCEDITGARQEWILTQNPDPNKPEELEGVWMPPYIFHIYEALETAFLLVITNTLFIHEDPRTHDTKYQAQWDELKKNYRG